MNKNKNKNQQLGLGARVALPGAGLLTIYEASPDGSYGACRLGDSDFLARTILPDDESVRIVTPAWLFPSKKKVYTPPKGTSPAKLKVEIGDYVLSDGEGVGEVVWIKEEYDSRDYPLHVRWWWGGEVDILNPYGSTLEGVHHKLTRLKEERA